jgi:hypothetical protein
VDVPVFMSSLLLVPFAQQLIAEGTDQDSRALAFALLNTAWAATTTVLLPFWD